MKRSILLDSQADLLMYGMGEKSIIEIADALNAGMDVKDITYIDGTVFKTAELDESFPTIVLPPFEEVKKNKRAYAESFKIQYGNRQAAGRAVRPGIRGAEPAPEAPDHRGDGCRV